MFGRVAPAAAEVSVKDHMDGYETVHYDENTKQKGEALRGLPVFLFNGGYASGS